MITLKKTLKKKLDDEELDVLRRGFDLVGDIAQLEIPDFLKTKEKIIANAVMALHKHVKVVVKKTGATAGEERIRPVKVIAGEKRTETVHIESGFKFKLDLNKVYFTSRLSSERSRVFSQVKEGETVFDLFAGVGVFSIPAAKKAAKVVAIDINKDACFYLKENAMLNKVFSKIEIYCGDCRKVIEEHNFENCADRVIMNLPMKAAEFLDIAFKIAKRGAIVHFYTFLPEKELFDGGIKRVEAAAKEAKKTIEIINTKKCGQLSPRIWRVAIDFKIL
jgi:tRNA (guanine37-N1)-methyltransferase